MDVRFTLNKMAEVSSDSRGLTLMDGCFEKGEKVDLDSVNPSECHL